MDFLELEDFYKVIQQNELEVVVGEITNPTDPGIAILDSLELDAMDEMTGYLAVRFDAKKCFATKDDDGNPINRIPMVIQKAVDIVLYNAYSRKHPNNIPNLRVTRYENAVNWLEKVAHGFINPDLPVHEDLPRTPLRYNSAQRKQDNFY